MQRGRVFLGIFLRLTGTALASTLGRWRGCPPGRGSARCTAACPAHTSVQEGHNEQLGALGGKQRQQLTIVLGVLTNLDLTYKAASEPARLILRILAA